MEHICPICGKAFEGRADKVYCSADCKNEGQKQLKRKQREEKHGEVCICAYCGKEFERGWRRKAYCSEHCRHLATAPLVIAPKEERKPKPKKLSGTTDDLARIAREAAEHHMSYGEYVAMMDRRGWR